MHASAYEDAARFVSRRLQPEHTLRIADLGAYDVNGTLRPLFQYPNWHYTGYDIVPGPNVDRVLSSPYRWPEIPDQSFDVVVSSQVLEHLEAPWRWLPEIARITRTGGLVYVSTPNTIPWHGYPSDCWRAWPEGLAALFADAGLDVVEVYAAGMDTTCVGRKGTPSPAGLAAVVIGCYGDFTDHVRLGLTALRRFNGPRIPVLLADDASPPACQEALRELAASDPFVWFEGNAVRLGHSGGDLSHLYKGLRWASRLEVHTLVKLSQRMVILRPNWVLELHERLAASTATIAGRAMAEAAELRGELIGFKVASWSHPSTLIRFAPQVRQGCNVEAYLMELATSGGWVELGWLPNRREKPCEQVVWHHANRAEDYAEAARILGLAHVRPYHVGPWFLRS